MLGENAFDIVIKYKRYNVFSEINVKKKKENVQRPKILSFILGHIFIELTREIFFF